MPQLIFKGVKRDHVKELSATLVGELSKISSTPEEWFTFECVENPYFSKGKEFAMYPLIEIIQFDRGLEVEEKIAKYIGAEVKKLGYETCELYFIDVFKNRYYEL